MASCGFSALAACTPTPPVSRTAAVFPANYAPVPDAGFAAWVSSFRGRAIGQGIAPAVFDAAFADAGFIPEVVNRDRNQIESRRTFEDYLSIAASDDRIAKGRQAILQFKDTLNAVGLRYGVDPLIVAAIWGVESRYGERRGQVPVISATATLAYDGRRGRFYEGQLIAALRILQAGDTTPDQLRGSWAGAMGHTQFIPTSYLALAVDFDGDGRRDIWADDPMDALASTGAYLARNGWQNGLPWGAEAGVGVSEGRRVQPQEGGPVFNVTRNFDVLKTYNNSDFYAIGVGHLADRLGGAGPLRGSFPPDANGLTKADRMALQRGLAARGYDIGTVDGVIGSQTEDAIRAFEASQGLPVRGVADRQVLARLR